MVRHRQKLKLEALSAYSLGKSICSLCDEDDINVLTLDHMDGGGREELKQLNIKGGSSYYRWLRVNNYPNKDRLRVLCMNHNCSARMIYASPEFIQSVVSDRKFVLLFRMFDHGTHNRID